MTAKLVVWNIFIATELATKQPVGTWQWQEQHRYRMLSTRSVIHQIYNDDAELWLQREQAAAHFVVPHESNRFIVHN